MSSKDTLLSVCLHTAFDRVQRSIDLSEVSALRAICHSFSDTACHTASSDGVGKASGSGGIIAMANAT